MYDFFGQSQRERLYQYENLKVLLYNTMMVREDIVGISVYDAENNKIIGTGKEMDFLMKFKDMNQFTYSDVIRPNSSSPTSYYWVSYPVYDIKNGNYDKKSGIIRMILKTDRISSNLKEIAITENQQIYLLDKRNMVIASEGGSDYIQLDTELLADRKNSYVTIKTQEETGWQIISVIPADELYSGMPIVRGAILVIYLMTLAGMLALLCFCYYIVIRPIRKIDFFVKNSTAYPNKRLEVKGKNEISVLTDNLNRMLDERDRTGEELRQAQRVLYETELAKQQIQVLAYRNQINPHFLYNTFECIRAMALYYDADEIAEISMALSKIFRFAIKGENIVKVEDEIANIREYAKIIHYRFRGRIEIQIESEMDTRNKSVIKLILQPIVENSVFHGLEQKLDEGKVTVRTKCLEEGRLLLEVEDNGCGIEEEKLKKMWYKMKRQSLHHSQNKQSIGLANIYHRLRLFYGENAEFLIESELNKGTRVKIIVPDKVSGREDIAHV